MLLSSYLSSLMTREGDLPSPLPEKSRLSLKASTNSAMELETVKDTSKSSPWERTQRYYQGKFISLVVSKQNHLSRKGWCCATGVKLGRCLARIALWLHPPLKILVCFFLSRVVLLHRIKILYSLIPLWSFTFAMNPCKNLQP